MEKYILPAAIAVVLVAIVVVVVLLLLPAAPAPVAQASPQPLVVSNTGDKDVQLSLKKGVARLSISHTGQSLFMAQLGKDVLVTHAGPYSGSSLVEVPQDGSYMLSMRTSGGWKVSVEDMGLLKSVPSEPLRSRYSGYFNTSYKITLPAGKTAFVASHSGQIFSVRLYSDSGEMLGVIAVGDKLERSVEPQVAGDFYLDIRSDGEWSLSTHAALQDSLLPLALSQRGE